MSPPVTLDASEHRLLRAARVIADVNHAGKRDPTRGEDQELLDAIAQYGDAARAHDAAELSGARTSIPTTTQRKARR